MAPVQFAHQIRHARTAAGVAPTADGIVSAAVAKLRDGAIVDAQLGPSPAEASGGDGASSASGVDLSKEKFLDVTVPAPAPAPALGAAAVRAEWLAQLLGGSVNDDLVASRLGDLASVLVSVRLPSGEVVKVSGGYGNVVPEQRFSTERLTDLETGLRSGMASVGLKVEQMNFEVPMQAAPVIIATTADPAGFVAAAQSKETFTQMLGDYRNLEGWYIEVRDSQGWPVWISAVANRTGVGIGWTRPDFDSLDRAYPNG